jgi:hypothetical protein
MVAIATSTALIEMSLFMSDLLDGRDGVYIYVLDCEWFLFYWELRIFCPGYKEPKKDEPHARSVPQIKIPFQLPTDSLVVISMASVMIPTIFVSSASVVASGGMKTMVSPIGRVSIPRSRILIVVQ